MRCKKNVARTPERKAVLIVQHNAISRLVVMRPHLRTGTCLLACVQDRDVCLVYHLPVEGERCCFVHDMS
jgi:hypothetical protein